MSDNYTRIDDTINSREGKAYITVDGENRELFETSKVEANIDLTVISTRMFGNRMTQHKVVGAEGTGSASLYFMNSQQLKNTIDYINGGKCKNMKLQVRNEDPKSSIGAQEVVLENVIFKKIPVFVLDDGSDDPVAIDSDFTFDGIIGLEYFKLPENYR